MTAEIAELPVATGRPVRAEMLNIELCVLTAALNRASSILTGEMTNAVMNGMRFAQHSGLRFAPQSKARQGFCSFKGCEKEAFIDLLSDKERNTRAQAYCIEHLAVKLGI